MPSVHNPQILVFCQWLETWETITLVMDLPFSSPWLNVSYVYKPQSELHTPFVHNTLILVSSEWLETWETIILVMD
jgi:hypothetical protein